MKRLVYAVTAALAAVLIIGLAPVLSQDKGGDGKRDAEPKDAWQKLHAPGEQHEWLAGLVGEWDVTSRMYLPTSDGSEKVVESSGSSTIKMLEGRFLVEEISMETDGRKSITMGFMGYDNDAKEFQACYVGDWSTSMLVHRGQKSDDGKTLTLISEYTINAFNKARIRERMVTTMPNTDEMKSVFYQTRGDGPEFRFMETTMKRKK
jgi:hypothetical protein